MGDEGLARLAAPSLDRHLTRHAIAPLIVAFSGGGDSLALLLAASAWVQSAGRRLLAVTVDHRLQADSAAWSAACAVRCRRLGIEHRALVWTGERPVTGVAAAARRARHLLITDAARAAGAHVILMGHTADDRLEARLMRAEGVGVSEPREWSPSPIWPEGRDLFILRPLMDVRRGELREILGRAGETWIEDPANADLRHPRVRARNALAGGGEARSAQSLSCAASLVEAVTEGRGGDLFISRRALNQAGERPLHALLGAAILCAAGSVRPPRRERLARLVGRLAEQRPFVATLAGSRIEAGDAGVRIAREAADQRCVRAAPLPLPTNAAVVWDGRSEIVAYTSDLRVTMLRGSMSRLDSAGRHALKAVAPAARPSLPAVIDAAGRVTCPSLLPDARATVRSLILLRLAGALGAIQNEAAIGRVAERQQTS